MFKAAGEFVGKLFGSAKAVETMTSGAVSGLDAIVFTSEEKANLAKEILFKLQDQWQPRALSRRIIAIMITAIFCIFLLVGLVLACFSMKEQIKLMIEFAVAFQLGWIMLTIVVFYFGYYGFLKNKGK